MIGGLKQIKGRQSTPIITCPETRAFTLSRTHAEPAPMGRPLRMSALSLVPTRKLQFNAETASLGGQNDCVASMGLHDGFHDGQAEA